MYKLGDIVYVKDYGDIGIVVHIHENKYQVSFINCGDIGYQVYYEESYLSYLTEEELDELMNNKYIKFSKFQQKMAKVIEYNRRKNNE